MSIRKNIFIALAVILAAFYGGDYIVRAAQEAMIVTDMAGRTVNVPKLTRRIVCVGPGTLRLITYLEATDRVVALESGFEKDSPAGRPYRIAHPELATLPTIGQASPSPQPNPEALLQVRPDVIFISYAEKRVADELEEKTGIPVIVLSYGNMATFDNEHVFDSLRIAGKILNKMDRAQDVIRFIRDCEKDLMVRAEKMPDNKRPGVYVGGLGFKGTHGITSTDYSYPPFELLIARNVARKTGKQGHIFVDKEKILEWNPEIIFIDAGGMDIVKDEYRKDPEFYRLLKAVQNDDVYVLFPYNHYTTNIDTAIADAYYIGKIIYPGSFRDIDPEKKADEIYLFLVGSLVYGAMKNDWSGFRKAVLE